MSDALDIYRLLETPEGVELRLPVAGPAARALAWGIDCAIRGLIYVLASIVLGQLDQVGAGALLLLLFALEWLYPLVFELWRGQTPGKRFMKLLVVHADGTPLGLSAALLRNLLRFADFLPFAYLTGLVSMLLSRDFRRLGDLVGGTIVIHAASSSSATSEIPPAAPLEPPLSLSHEEELALVSFAARQAELSEERRQELARHLGPLAEGEDPVARALSYANWTLGRR